MGFRVPSLAAIRARTLDDVNRWIAQAAAALQPVFEVGTDRIQGFDVPKPTSVVDGQAITWDNASRSFVYRSVGVSPTTRIIAGAGLTGGGPLSSDVTIAMANVIAAGGPIGSSTIVPVITWNARGQLTVVGTATVSGLPAATRVGQWLASKDGATFSVIQYDNVLDIPPASPSAFDDEFPTTTLDPKWTAEAGVVAGTVDLYTPVGSGAIYDLVSFPGTLKLQNHNDNVFRGIKQDIATLYAATPEVTCTAKLMMGYAGGPNLPQMDIFISDATLTNWVRVGIEQFVSVNRVGALYFDSSPTDAGFQINATNSMVAMPVYFALRCHLTGGVRTWFASASVGGYSWQSLDGTTGHTLNFTPKYVWIRQCIPSGTTAVGGCSWIRFTSTAALPGGG